MTNFGIVNVVASQYNPVESVAKITCKLKDEDFKTRIDEVLKYLDCDAFNAQAREGFRIFAKHLKESVESCTDNENI